MKRHLMNIVFDMLALPASTLYAQNIATASIRWNSASIFEVHTATTLDETTSVITSPGHIVWEATDGTIQYDFVIVETNGSWADVSTPGSVTYEVNASGRQGVIEFRKNINGIVISIVLATEGDPLVYELTIDHLELL